MDGHTPTNPPINQQHFSRSPPKVFWIIISCSARYPVRPLFHFSINHLQTFFLSLLFPPRCEPVLDSHHQSHPSIHHHCVAVWRISYSYPYFPVPASHFMSFLIPKDIPIPKQKTENKKQEQTPPSSAAPLSSSSHKWIPVQSVNQKWFQHASPVCVYAIYISASECVCVCVCV